MVGNVNTFEKKLTFLDGKEGHFSEKQICNIY